MERRRKLGRGLALLLTIGLAGASAAVPAAAEDQDGTGGGPAAQVEWGECPADVVAQAQPHVLTCATVPVPLDYAEPDGEQIDVMISRLASTNTAERRGILLLNPGGPGSAGLDFPAVLKTRGMPDSVLDAYDLIGMDTRGVGHSTPVDCKFTMDDAYFSNVPPYAVDDAAVLANADVARSAAEQCARNDTEGHMQHVTTANIARDLDQVRAALGEDKASFLGYSYGSALGAAYASLFPETSDRVIIDSNLGDTALDREGLRRFGLGTEQTFPDFARWAAKRHAAYGLGRTPAQVRATYFETAERLDQNPVEGLDGTLFRFVSFAGLYGESSYAGLAQTWQSVRSGDGEAALRLAETFRPDIGFGAGPPGAGTAGVGATAAGEPWPASNAWSAYLAVTCNDVDWSENVDTYREAVAEDRQRYPLYGAATANVTPCAFWSNEPVEPPVQITDEGPRNVLIMQNRRDPATPHLGAELAREKFGERARLVSVDGSGHGVYVIGGNACALNVGTAYLVDGEMPRRDQACRAD
ncbi:alpha/beta hydrolase [Promicromonospora sp. MS192]|uniref:alpha/beta hydrolase n=1 Tax=Promicromonospora sp. MS192 TaxID=3412684 RepID=UPI003C2F9DE6